MGRQPRNAGTCNPAPRGVPSCEDEGMATSTLERPRDGRIIAGVCAALANRFGISVTLIRVLFVIFAITGAAEIVYIILWIVIPKE